MKKFAVSFLDEFDSICAFYVLASNKTLAKRRGWQKIKHSSIFSEMIKRGAKFSWLATEEI